MDRVWTKPSHSFEILKYNGEDLAATLSCLRLLRSQPCVIPKQTDNPRQRGRQRGLRAGQYSLGKWITLLAKYSVISSSGKSVCSMFLVNTMLPLPSSHVSVAVRSGCTASFQT